MRNITTTVVRHSKSMKLKKTIPVVVRCCRTIHRCTHACVESMREELGVAGIPVAVEGYETQNEHVNPHGNHGTNHVSRGHVLGVLCHQVGGEETVNADAESGQRNAVEGEKVGEEKSIGEDKPVSVKNQIL